MSITTHLSKVKWYIDAYTTYICFYIFIAFKKLFVSIYVSFYKIKEVYWGGGWLLNFH